MASKLHFVGANVGWMMRGARYGRHDRPNQHAHSVWAASAKQQEARHPSSFSVPGQMAGCVHIQACSTPLLSKPLLLCSLAQHRASIQEGTET